MTSEHLPLTEEQRIELCNILTAVLIEIRRLGCQSGNAEQAGLLADAFHNVPTEMWQEHFSLMTLRDSYIAPYSEKYPSDAQYDFMVWIEEVILMSSKNNGGQADVSH